VAATNNKNAMIQRMNNPPSLPLAAKQLLRRNRQHMNLRSRRQL
jgi:hypothetical protein